MKLNLPSVLESVSAAEAEAIYQALDQMCENNRCFLSDDPAEDDDYEAKVRKTTEAAEAIMDRMTAEYCRIAG